MSAQEVIAEIEALSEKERLVVVDYVQRKALAEAPESFRRGMSDALAGRGEKWKLRCMKRHRRAADDLPVSGD